jgi:Nucleoside-diphosphate-sugar pyrophosphorylase involved in lipopolysaccharide biosynthesis/translation initiation factor 2B, gamma/epsilon subunits (eIF-2Bgamma/eIF-2Bepsilon)
MPNFSLLILCAGFGKRMLDLTSNIPKPLLKFNNQTLLSNTVNFFQDIGCNEIFINTHYLNEKIETFVNKEFYNYPIHLIHEPSILGTGGGVKNIFNYTKNKNICVVNSDIFWQQENKLDIINFLKDFTNVTHCKILLSKKNNFQGLKKTKGDFNIQNEIVSNWIKNNEIIFFSGLQIVSKNIFQETTKIFPMNEIWNNLIIDKNLKGDLISSKILHIGDKNSFETL